MNAQLKGSELIDCGLLELTLRRPARVAGLIDTGGADGADLCLRLAEIGFLEGERVEVIAQAAFGGPLAVRVGTATFALRRVEALAVRVCLEP